VDEIESGITLFKEVNGMKRLLLVAVFGLLISPGYSLSFEDAELESAARQYHQKIKEDYRTKGEESKFSPWLDWLQQFFSNGKDEDNDEEKWNEAITRNESAIAKGDDNADLWMALSKAWRSKPFPDLNRSLASAYNAFERASSPSEHFAILSMIADLYERQGRPRRAIETYREVISIKQSSSISERLEKLMEDQALELQRVEVDQDRADPRFCLVFPSHLAGIRKVKYEDYLRIEPAIDASFSVREKTLCVSGGGAWSRLQGNAFEGFAGCCRGENTPGDLQGKSSGSPCGYAL